MPRVGLKLSRCQEAELNERYQGARANKDLDMCLRIQGLLLVHRGNTEIMAADMIGVGRRTLQDWICRYRQRGISGLITPTRSEDIRRHRLASILGLAWKATSPSRCQAFTTHLKVVPAPFFTSPENYLPT